MTFIDKTNEYYDKYTAYSHVEIKENWVYHKNYRFCDIDPKEILIGVESNDVDIDQEYIILMFLHELAHCTAFHYQIKQNKDHVDDYHGENFYKQYSEILRWAEHNKIYKLTFGKKKRFCKENLERINNLKKRKLGEILYNKQ